MERRKFPSHGLASNLSEGWIPHPHKPVVVTEVDSNDASSSGGGEQLNAGQESGYNTHVLDYGTSTGTAEAEFPGGTTWPGHSYLHHDQNCPSTSDHMTEKPDQSLDTSIVTVVNRYATNPQVQQQQTMMSRATIPVPGSSAIPGALIDSCDTEIKLACPYFQRNKNGPRLERSCAGPGFPTIPRLKEHLYRRHMCFVCQRCGTQFEKPSHLANHTSENPPCEPNSVQPDLELGFGRDIEKKLRAKKRNMQWRDIYLILFPTDEPSTIPSPYYSTEVDDGIRNYQAYLERVTLDQLPRVIRDKFVGLDEEILSHISLEMPHIVNRILASASRQYVSAPNMDTETFQAIQSPDLHEQHSHSVPSQSPVTHAMSRTNIATPDFPLWRAVDTHSAEGIEPPLVYPMEDGSASEATHLGRSLPEMGNFPSGNNNWGQPAL
ncbi:hypothetical protein Cpir12675_006590 [Ceratocystis pirilliformis]|uniref:C2H2-type domain-containing protein n=1 Tax=Ceratocystis pirilliformis TaxID=259994 RepID=A0ABR3YG89_9PEZI